MPETKRNQFYEQFNQLPSEEKDRFVEKVKNKYLNAPSKITQPTETVPEGMTLREEIPVGKGGSDIPSLSLAEKMRGIGSKVRKTAEEVKLDTLLRMKRELDESKFKVPIARGTVGGAADLVTLGHPERLEKYMPEDLKRKPPAEMGGTEAMVQQLGELLLGRIPAAFPAHHDTRTKPDRINFLTHSISYSG